MDFVAVALVVVVIVVGVVVAVVVKQTDGKHKRVRVFEFADSVYARVTNTLLNICLENLHKKYKITKCGLFYVFGGEFHSSRKILYAVVSN